MSHVMNGNMLSHLLAQINNRNTKARPSICSKLTIKKSKRSQ